MTEQSIGESTPPQAAPAPASTMTPFGDPNGGSQAAPPLAPVRQWTIDDILNTAKTPEGHARVCLRADLQAEHDQLRAELNTLVDAQGKVLEDDERSAGEQSKAARAQEIVDRLAVVSGEMAESMWFPLFRGLSTDDLADFNKAHKPKSDGDGEPDMSEYNTLLVAECSIASVHGPKLSVNDVRQLRKKLGARAMGAMVAVAHDVCSRGGVDFPTSPGFSGRPKLQ